MSRFRRNSISARNMPIREGSGGPAGVIYGYLAVWLGTMAVFASLSELASM